MIDKETKQKEAAERQTIHNKLTNQEKIKKLDERLGVNQGAKKERKRLS